MSACIGAAGGEKVAQLYKQGAQLSCAMRERLEAPKSKVAPKALTTFKSSPRGPSLAFSPSDVPYALINAYSFAVLTVGFLFHAGP